jgi:hypothetical protein
MDSMAQEFRCRLERPFRFFGKLCKPALPHLTVLDFICRAFRPFYETTEHILQIGVSFPRPLCHPAARTASTLLLLLMLRLLSPLVGSVHIGNKPYHTLASTPRCPSLLPPTRRAIPAQALGPWAANQRSEGSSPRHADVKPNVFQRVSVRVPLI